jgi:hypothetical protein
MQLNQASRFAGIVSRVFILLVFALAAYRAALLSWSDFVGRSGTQSAFRKAESIMPSNARFHFLHALAIEQSDPLSPQIASEFSTAVNLNPRFSDALLAWSVDKELHGDRAGAEELLRRAQSVDHLIRPAWALANFYFRQGQPDLFWPQARECLRMIGVTGLAVGRFDPSPVYQLCWRMTSDSSLILSKAIPDDRVIRDHYLGFLMGTGRYDAAIGVADLNLKGAVPGELAFYLPYMNWMMWHNHVPVAIRTWRSLYEAKALPYPGPDPVAGVFLTDPSFQAPPLNHAFDWRLGSLPDSVRFTYSPEHSYHFALDGSEPEQFVAMGQTLPLIPGRSYRFSASYRAEFDPEEYGLRWSITDHASGRPLPLHKSVSGTSDGKTLIADFEAPAAEELVDLWLTYDRQPGTPHARGLYELIRTDLKPTRN